MNKMIHRYYLGLGGNLGDVASVMHDTLEFLSSHNSIELIQFSKLYKTPPWGNLDQPDFLNACIEIATHLSPEELLDICQNAENKHLRERDIRWGPRTIDIDILFASFGSFESNRLLLPHPRMFERAFVLVPLADIAGDVKLAGNLISVWCDKLDISQIETAGEFE